MPTPPLLARPTGTAPTAEHATAAAQLPRWLSRHPALWVTGALVLLYLYSALIPFEFDPGGWQGPALRERVRWVPFRDQPAGRFGLHTNLGNALVNLAAGVPLGWFAFLAGRRSGALSAWLLAVGVAALTAAGMEALQLLVPGRDVTMTDVVTIALGGGAGAGAALFLADPVGDWLKRRLAGHRWADRQHLALFFGLAILALVALFPDNVATSLGAMKQTVRRAHLIPGALPGRDTSMPPSGLARVPYGCRVAGLALLYTLIGASFQRVRRGRGLTSVLSTGLAVGLLALGVELLQLFLPSQRVDVNEALAGLVGGGLGAAAGSYRNGAAP